MEETPFPAPWRGGCSPRDYEDRIGEGEEENRCRDASVLHTMKRLVILALPVLPIVLAGCGKGKY
jgi:hypothetical protein